MPGAQCTRSLVCDKNKHTSVVTTGPPEITRHSRTQWFYGLLRALPGDQACLTPSSAVLIADLTPASGRQNHTTSPYASAPFVKGTAASTASRPALMTLRNAPLKGRDRIAIVLILPRRQTKILKIRNLWGCRWPGIARGRDSGPE